MIDLAAFARSLPGVTVGIACAGTSLESRTFDVGDRTFLFVSPHELRLKLADSADDAKQRGLVVGKNGWVKIPYAAAPGATVLKRWITESHGLMAPKQAPRAAKPPRRR